MNRIVVERRVNGEGILQLTIPLGVNEAGKDVRITLEPVNTKSKITLDEWRATIQATSGGWQGEFDRPPQGEVEEREPLS
jgi:hypothetical protein